MTIYVTPGETRLITAFENIETKINLENLFVGDIHIRNNDNTVYIIERKARSDLLSSIIDKRYEEQKQRLIQTGIPLKNIIYILENIDEIMNDPKTLGAITHTQHYDGMTVYITKNTDETAKYITKLAKTVSEIPASNDTTPVCINIKKQSVTPETWFFYSLTLIKGCSPKIATAIIDKYSTFTKLRSAFEADKNCLNGIKINNRAVPKPVIARIYDCVFSN